MIHLLHPLFRLSRAHKRLIQLVVDSLLIAPGVRPFRELRQTAA